MSYETAKVATMPTGEIPRGDAAGFVKYFRNDFVSGLLVFLIALPLCIGISRASGFPSLAGVFTAIIGALLATFISNSELTIKGPAAGLIVIVLGCINSFGGDGMIGGWSEIDAAAYQATLAVGVVAAVLQILFGFFRAGILGEFFPTAVVHGMLAAIGVIIIAKQIPDALGVKPNGKGEPLELLRQIPEFVVNANPIIAIIGGVSLAIMFVWPTVRKRIRALRLIPGPLVVLVVAIPLGIALDVHSDQFLVKMPDEVFGMFKEIAFPDFSALRQAVAWKWVLMFFMIGSLESLLSAKAVDSLDPWRRKANMNRDIIAVGTANLAASMIGGLPMISEIVRSRANLDNGAKTRFANFWHGIFLLLCVAFIPMVLHLIPLAALAAMLVYTGSRLAHPTEFMNVYRIGREQFVIFVTTLVAVLMTDLLIGIAIGIAVKLAIHFLNGVPLRSMFKPYLEIEDIDETTSLITASGSAVFSNWIPFRRQIEQVGLVQQRNLVIDMSNTKLIDHNVMEKLDEMQSIFEHEGLEFEVIGLDTMQPMANSSQASRDKSVAVQRRIIVIAEEQVAEVIRDGLLACGARSLARQSVERFLQPDDSSQPMIPIQSERLEVVVTQDVAKKIIAFLRNDILPLHDVEVCVEHVDKIQADFASARRTAAATSKLPL